MAINRKQLLLVSYLANSSEVLAVSAPILKPEYFEPEFRKGITFLLAYYNKYNAMPTLTQVMAEANTELDKVDMDSPTISYALDELEHFCRRKALIQVAMDVPKLAAEGRESEIESRIKDAVAITMHQEMGVSYFDNPKQRVDRLSKMELRTETGWPNLDMALGGGLARKELLLFTANSGGGKSVALSNMSASFAERGYNVLYLSLELSEDLVTQRFDAIYTGINSTPYSLWKTQYQNIAPAIENYKKECEAKYGKKCGILDIKRKPTGTTSSAIRAYIREFIMTYGVTPDLLVVDYLDLMGSNEHISVDNISQKDKRATEELRDLLDEFNMFGATASQQTRDALTTTDLNQGHIAGGITKVNTVDWHVSIVFTEQMRATNEMMWVLLKTRSSNSVFQKLFFDWVPSHLRITSRSESSRDRSATADKPLPAAGRKTHRTISDILNDI